MHIRSLASWLLLSYFTPFIAFFFGIFWFGLNVWLFLIGMLIISILTLSLFLKVKDWELSMYRLLQNSEKAKNQPTIVAKPLNHTHSIPSIKNLFIEKPHCEVELIARDVKEAYTSLELDHERIVQAYEEERNKLFDEITHTKHELQRQQVLISEKDESLTASNEKIKNLKIEMEILLGMDQELLRSAVSEC